MSLKFAFGKKRGQRKHVVLVADAWKFCVASGNGILCSVLHRACVAVGRFVAGTRARASEYAVY